MPPKHRIGLRVSQQADNLAWENPALPGDKQVGKPELRFGETACSVSGWNYRL